MVNPCVPISLHALLKQILCFDFLWHGSLLLILACGDVRNQALREGHFLNLP